MSVKECRGIDSDIAHPETLKSEQSPFSGSTSARSGLATAVDIGRLGEEAGRGMLSLVHAWADRLPLFLVNVIRITIIHLSTMSPFRSNRVLDSFQ